LLSLQSGALGPKPRINLVRLKEKKVASIPGNGTGFQINLPSLDGAKIPQSERAAPLKPVRVRILFVDDEPLVVESTGTLLEHLGYLVTALTNSLKARELFHYEPHEYDLVITDMAMPRMSGLELAADLLKVRPDLPIILYSGGIETFSSEAARESGIREFLKKPANIGELAQAIRRVLEAEEY
jgi:CheY-like chemotaxis protein